VRAWIGRHPGAAVFTLLAGLFVIYEIAASFVAYTADAFVLSDLVTVAPEVAGPISRIAVERNQPVKAGDLLFEIDPEPFALKVAAAEAALELAKADEAKAKTQVSASADAVTEAEAVLQDAKLTYQRLAAIVASGAITEQRVDDAKRDFDQAAARVAELRAMQSTAAQDVLVHAADIAVAEAALAEARYDLTRTRIVAATDGTVAPYQTKVGDYAEVGKPVMAVVAAGGWRVVANLPDYYLGAIAPGQPVLVHIATDPWRLHWATVRSVPPGVARHRTPLEVLPYVTPTTEWIRLPRRFPIEVDLGDLPERQRLFSGADARILMVADTFSLARPAASR
jgi:multidrug efflux system membrane fusion protein